MTNLNEYQHLISQPISEESPVGERLIDDPLFEFVDEQMMKIGSLAHASIQWNEVEKAALTLLSEKTKDIKLLTYFIQCLHHQATPERMILSVNIMSDFIEKFWNDCFPSPGERGKLPRRKFFSLLLQRFSLLLDKYNFSSFDNNEQQTLLSSLEHWKVVIEKNELDSSEAQRIIQTIETKFKQAEERESIDQGQSTDIYVNPSPTNSRSSALSLDSSSDQAIKDTFLNISDFLSDRESNELLAIRVRRYASWSNIDSAPEHNKDGETQLRAMLPEKLKEYNDGMTNPDISLWRKLEKSLTLAPYWIDGHFLSAQIAQAIGQQKWSEAIHDEAKQFVERLPKLLNLTFKDGSAFVSNDTKTWLESSQSSGLQAGNSDWLEITESMNQVAIDAGLSVAISRINDGLDLAVEPRDKFYWRFILAELLEKNQLQAMANEQYKVLYEQASNTTLNEWEPSLIERLNLLVSQASVSQASVSPVKLSQDK